MAHATGGPPNLTRALQAKFADIPAEDPKSVLALAVLEIVKSYLGAPQQSEVTAFIESKIGSDAERRFAESESPPIAAASATAVRDTMAVLAAAAPQSTTLIYSDAAEYSFAKEAITGTAEILSMTENGGCLFTLKVDDATHAITAQDAHDVEPGYGVAQFLAQIKTYRPNIGLAPK